MRAAAAALAAAAAGPGCSAAGLANALAPRGGYAVRRDLAYGPDPRHRLDLYLPDAPAAPGVPLVVFFHGGNWEAGSKDLYLFVGEAFASRGIAVAVPNYRLYPAVRHPAFLEDAAAAVAWLAQGGGGGQGGRPAVLAGHSAGAYIAAMLALDGRWLARAGAPRPAGLVGLAGPYDFLPLRDPMLRDLFHADRDPDGLPATQPIAHADGADPPALLLTGDADREVRPGNSGRLAARLRAAGGTAELVVYPGLGHVGVLAALAAPLRPFSAPVLDDVAGFVARLAPPPPPVAAPMARAAGLR